VCLHTNMARKYHDAEWLEQEYVENKRGTPDIARECGVVKETIRRWLHKHDIPVRKRGPEKGREFADTEQLEDRDWLHEQYVQKEKSAGQISNEIGCGEQTVYDWLNRHGIETRDAGDVFTRRSSRVDKRLEDEQWLRKEYEQRGRAMYDIAQQLDVTAPAIKYRLDEFGIERRETDDNNLSSDPVYQRDPNWDEKREERLAIDNHTCQDCGVDEEDYYRSLDVHHTQMKSEFENPDGDIDWERANDPSNLISLCQSCHMKRHHKEE